MGQKWHLSCSFVCWCALSMSFTVYLTIAEMKWTELRNLSWLIGPAAVLHANYLKGHLGECWHRVQSLLSLCRCISVDFAAPYVSQTLHLTKPVAQDNCNYNEIIWYIDISVFTNCYITRSTQLYFHMKKYKCISFCSISGVFLLLCRVIAQSQRTDKRIEMLGNN